MTRWKFTRVCMLKSVLMISLYCGAQGVGQGWRTIAENALMGAWLGVVICGPVGFLMACLLMPLFRLNERLQASLRNPIPNDGVAPLECVDDGFAGPCTSHKTSVPDSSLFAEE
ncbi:MAG: hypothetical protein KF861_02570 [Planctomycetaceae bacterium]|nr:hypothetical protein [Planctomycetaceae bacterium]